MFDDEEQNQDEITPLPARLRFAYRLMGLDPDSDRQLGGSPARAMQRQDGTPEMRAIDGDQGRPRLQQEPWIPRKPSIGQRLMQRDAAPVQRADGNRSSGIATGMVPPLPVIDGTRSSSVLQRKPQTPRKLSIGQRLMGLDAASGQRGNGGSGIAPKLTIGQRLMGLDGRRRFSVGNPQAQQRLSNRFSPGSALPSRFESTNNRWSRHGKTAFAPGQQAAPNSPPSGSTAVLDMTAETKVRSRIPRPGAVQEVEPNPTLSDPKQQTKARSKLPTKQQTTPQTKEQVTALGRLMRDIRQSKPPRALQYLSPAEEEEAAHLARSENTRGTVAEHEAVISVILNRVQSGLDQRRQYLDRGQEANVHNVINAHTGRGVHQFQGLDNNEYRRNFARLGDQGAQNARTAAGNIATHGPTNKATAFIITETDPVTGQPKKPEQRTVSHLGHVHFVGQVGHVFLYAPDPPQARSRPHATAVHHHPAPHHSK